MRVLHLLSQLAILFGLQGFRQYSDDTTVDFEVFLSEESMMRTKQEGLLKKFKLTTTISTSNMHLFDSKGVIKKYDTPEQSELKSMPVLQCCITLLKFVTLFR